MPSLPPSRTPRRGLLRSADVRRGERWVVLSSSLQLAGIIAAHVCLETARDALFLAQLEPGQLAFVYIGLALVVAGIGRIESVVERTLGRANALVLTLMVTAAGTTLFFVADRSAAVTFSLYLWVGLTSTLLLLQFWLFAGTRFSVAQGRRLYGLIAAGGVLGAVVGGGLSTLTTLFLPVESLLAVAACLHLATALVVTIAPPASSVAEPRERVPFSDLRAALRKNPYVKRIVALTFVSTLTLLLVDYSFKSATAEHIDKEQLGQFLALYYFGMNIVALVIQLLVAAQVLQRAGTVLTLCVLPVTLLFSSGSPLLIGGVLSGAILAKGADGSLRHSLHKVSVELLFLPLAPQERAATKGLVDSIITRGTQGIAALALLGLAALGWDSPAHLLTAVSGLSLAWVGVSLSMRRPYLNQFRAMMGREAGIQQLHLDQMSLDSVEVVLESLSSPNEQEVLSAISLFREARRTGLVPALLLYHPSEAVLLRGLEVIPSQERKDWPPLAERLLSHDSLQVQLAATRALGRFGHLDRMSPDDFEEPALIATASFFRADRMGRPLDHPYIARLAAGAEEDRGAQGALLDIVREQGSSRWAEVLLSLCRARPVDLAPRLAAAMQRVGDPRFVPHLIQMLDSSSAREQARQALLSLGEASFDGLCRALLDEASSFALQRRIALTIGRFETQAAADFLVSCLDEPLPGAVRYKVLQALGSMSQGKSYDFDSRRILRAVLENGRQLLLDSLLEDAMNEDLKSAEDAARPVGYLLVELLKDKQRQALDRITRLLQLLHPREKLRRVYHALSGNDPATRAAAAELVEVITLGYDEGLREVLRTVADAAPLAARKAHRAAVLGVEVDSALTAISALLETPDPALSALAAEYAEKRELWELAVLVQRVQSENPWLHQPISEPPHPRSERSRLGREPLEPR